MINSNKCVCVSEGGGGRSAWLLALIVLLIPAISACPGDEREKTDAEAPSPAAEQPADTALEPNPVQDTTAFSMDRFVSAVLGDVNGVWTGQFSGGGRSYREPKLNLFDGTIADVCEFTQPATAPFYCPTDNGLYIDTRYLASLRTQGDLGAAIAIAHHVAHHVQNLLGYTAEVGSMKAGLDAEKAADLELRFELQADFMAGMWAHHAKLLPAEVTEASVAAAYGALEASGAALPKLSEGDTVFAPDPLTHGTAEQRVRWFMRGFDTGDISFATTFKDKQL